MDSVKRKFLTNPRNTANLLSIIFFWWTIPIIRKSHANQFDEDVFEPRHQDRAEVLCQRLEKFYQNEPVHQYRLARAAFKTFRNLIIKTTIMYAVIFGERFVQTQLIGRFLLYFRNDSGVTRNEALILAIVMTTLTAMGPMMLTHYYDECRNFYNQLRISICALIYKKSLRLSQASLAQTSPGNIVNLMSTDMNCFVILTFALSAMCCTPLYTILTMYCLWREIQWLSVIGLMVVAMAVLVQSFAGKFVTKFNHRTALRTNERLQLMDEIISGAQVIKMYAWERPFAKIIGEARRNELEMTFKSLYGRLVHHAYYIFTVRISIFLTVVAFILCFGADAITVAKIYRIITLLSLLGHLVSTLIAGSVTTVIESLASFKRMQALLDYDEEIRVSHTAKNVSVINDGKNVQEQNSNDSNVAISVLNATALWVVPGDQKAKTKEAKDEKPMLPDVSNDNERPLTLQNINLEIPKGKLVGIVGPVGASKSSLLQMILRELPLQAGSMRINGTLSYAGQEPWIFVGSIRQNILFGQPMDRRRYDWTIEACDLAKDFESFERGDLSMIGERGVLLSGGQKSRLNLARAIYRQADIYLFDDPLSAVDAHVGVHLFKECLGPKSRLAQQNATRILVTHQVHFLKEADWVVVMRDGKIEVQGTNSDVQSSGVDFATLLSVSDDAVQIENGENESTEDITSVPEMKFTSNRRSRAYSGASSRFGSKTSLHSRKSARSDKEWDTHAEVTLALEKVPERKIKGSLLLYYLRSAERPVLLCLSVSIIFLTQFVGNTADYWLARWMQNEEQKTYHSHQVQSTKAAAFNDTTEVGVLETNQSALSTKDSALVYFGILSILIALACIGPYAFIKLCLSASQKLHDGMFNAVIGTTMRFFNTNPSGRIQNRFSKDLGSINGSLGILIVSVSQSLLIAIGAIALVTIMNPICAVPLLVLLPMVFLLREIFDKSMTNVRRLEGIAQPPVFTHITSSLNGLSTIRAFGSEIVLQKEFFRHQDYHTACTYMESSTKGAFALALDVASYIFVSCPIFSSVFFDTGVTGDVVGLTVTQLLALVAGSKFSLLDISNVENRLMAIERIVEYKNLEPEPEPEKPLHMSPEWPPEGQIEFRHVFYKYFAEAEPVLRDINFSIRPKEKIGIVGRTGAGKTSLIGSLFRLACVDGEILIDGVDTSHLLLRDLRSKISIIPQDPVLFLGTLRRNLDPLDEYNDDDIWMALEEVKLKELVGDSDGLQMRVMAQGGNFSVGQKQLLCLARALLRRNRILILDEATANVDPHTDAIIQQTIRERFVDCTVLTIAHRLHTIIDSDRVLVMDSGRISEFESPYALLQRESGLFKSMVDALGAQESDRLYVSAKDKFDSNNTTTAVESDGSTNGE